MTPPRITSDDERLELAAIARLEARMDNLEDDFKEHKDGCEMVKSRLRNDLALAREADSSSRYEAIKAERDDAVKELTDRKQARSSAARDVIVGLILLVAGTLLGYFMQGARP